jgi:hypothetical protein
MLSCTATIKTTNGTYEIDQKTNANNEVLFCVIHNGNGVYLSTITEALNWVKEHSEYHSSSREFTQKERDLMGLMQQADDIAQQLLEGTSNKQGYYDTIHPLAGTVKQLAWVIDDMLERMQLVK